MKSGLPILLPAMIEGSMPQCIEAVEVVAAEAAEFRVMALVDVAEAIP